MIENIFYIAKDPKHWINPIKLQAQHNFEATSPQEISIRAGQTVIVAPREIQQTQQLLNTGWALATIDFKQTGLIPINYLKRESMPTHTLTPNIGLVDTALKLPNNSNVNDDSTSTIPYEMNEAPNSTGSTPMMSDVFVKDATNCVKEEDA